MAVAPLIALGGALATAAATPVGIAAIAGGIGYAASRKAAKGSKADGPQALPSPPKPEDSRQKAQDIARRRKASATQTIYSSPLGISGQADVARKHLTGQ